MKVCKYLAAVCTLAVLMAMPVSAAEPMTVRSAEKLAIKLVPSHSEMIQSEEESGVYELRFYNKTRQEWYNIKINKAAGLVNSFDSSRTSSQGGKEAIITSEDAERKVTDEVAEVSIVSCQLLEEDDLYTYAVEFIAKTCYGTYFINAENGYILSRTIVVGTTPEFSGDITETSSSAIYIGTERARKLVLAKVPGAEMDDCQLVNENGRATYDGAMNKGCFKYEFSVDAITGTMIRWDISNTN